MNDKKTNPTVREREHQRGVCPLCGCEELNYCESDVEDDIIHFPWTCSVCGATGDEVYVMKFLGHGDVVECQDGDDNDEGDED